MGERTWQEWLPLPALTADAPQITAYLVEQGYLDTDGGMLFIGPEAERRFGHRHFMDLMAVFTAPPEFTVLHGRDEIGRIDPSLLADRVEGPRLLLLGGRSWRVTWTDWKRRRCFVEPAEGGGRARWLSDGVGGLSFEIARSMRDVLLGAEVPVSLTQPGFGSAGRVAQRRHRARARRRARDQPGRRRPALVDVGRVPGERHAEGDARQTSPTRRSGSMT